MTARRINLDVVTPERLVFSQEVDEMILPGSEGYFGVRPGHTRLLAGLGVGELSWSVSGQKRSMAVSLGYTEVLGDRVTVMAETAELAEEIDVERAKAARARAEERMSRSEDPQVRFDRARAAVLRAATRLNVAARKV